MRRSMANGRSAWDAAGVEYQLAWSSGDIPAVARAIKRGAHLGQLHEWGESGEIEWHAVPVDITHSSRAVVRWLRDQPWNSTATVFSSYASTHGPTIVLAYQDC